GGGGGISNSGTSAVVINSTFKQNIGVVDGGGIENVSPLTITNSTFAGNDAPVGGGIDNFRTLTVINSTFTGNGPTLGGGNVSNDPHGNGSGTIKSTILTAGGAGGNCLGTITDAGYNISDDSTCNFSVTGSFNNTNPMLNPNGLQNNGGPTQTIALLAGSPAIDAIPLADCTDQASPPNPIVTDQRLFPRSDAGETACDIGAYEVQDKPFLPFSRFTGSLKIDPDAGGFYLASGFRLGTSGSIDPKTQPVAFSVGSYAVRLPVGSFVKNSTGYVYQKRVNGIFLRIFIKFTPYPGLYQLLANRIGGTLTDTTSPVLVTLTVGNNSGSTQMNATFD
ncbi:MAG: hypothetical protein JO189_07365, partial [Deltaproteobacteria bacterium]|nr:hypothetical protein [Deltaproteobacteria bacterium]